MKKITKTDSKILPQHELEVPQIDLELKNGERRHACAVAKGANVQYIGVYDFAPFGSFTL